MYNKNSVMQTKRYPPRPRAAWITLGGRPTLAPSMNPTALLTFTAALLLAPLALATPRSGTKNIPGDYATLAAAMTDRNLGNDGGGAAAWALPTLNFQLPAAGGGNPT